VVPVGIILVAAGVNENATLPMAVAVNIAISADGFTPTCKVNEAPTQDPRVDELTGNTT
jgi:hypothetical protein